jgi:protein-S-isoprenylcysteine O-methyltransferase Ste14
MTLASIGANFAALRRSAPLLPLAKACPSSWVSWTTYWAGMALAYDEPMQAELQTGGPGLSVLLAGVAAFFAAVVMIQRHMRLSLLANSFGSPRRLLTSGVFRWSRNPIYAAFFFPIATLGYYSVPVAVLSAAVYVLAMNALVIRREEGELAARFGQDYLDYKQATRRWIV